MFTSTSQEFIGIRVLKVELELFPSDTVCAESAEGCQEENHPDWLQAEPLVGHS